MKVYIVVGVHPSYTSIRDVFLDEEKAHEEAAHLNLTDRLDFSSLYFKVKVREVAQ